MIRLVLLLVIALSSAASAQQPLILVVHGRGQTGRDSALVRREAWHALEMSTRRDDPSFALDEHDVRLVWYADVLDAQSAGVSLPRCPASQISESMREREEMPSVLSLLALIAGPIFQSAQNDAKGDDAMMLRDIAADLRYFSDLDARCAAELRVASALREAHRERRPVILISHSLGALVTWSELSHAAAVRDTTIGEIQRWITVGSPLGSTEIRQLVFGNDDDLTRPPQVRDWVNVMSGDDPFSVKISEKATANLSDITTATSHSEPHQILSYLFDTATGRSVREAWRSIRR
jgi:hypothetical protein